MKSTMNGTKFCNIPTELGGMLQNCVPFIVDFILRFESPTSLEKQAASHMWQVINEKEVAFDCLCGVPYAALPLAAVIATEHDVPMLMRRKESKDYGTKKMVEGNIVSGQRCVIIEDVVTSGSSILETAELLRKEGLVVTDAIVILDRQQWAAENLEKSGINVHSLIKLDDVLEYMKKEGTIDNEKAEHIKTVLSDVTYKDGPPAAERASVSWDIRSRLSSSKHLCKSKLLEVMRDKKSNLIVAADLTKADAIVSLADRIGPHICALKLHADMVEDFGMKLVAQLKRLSRDHNFLLFEDRKFADTGNTAKLQMTGLHAISSWADLITVHGFPGPGVLKGIHQVCTEKGIGVLLVAEMSSQGAMNCKQESLKLADTFQDIVVGFICQKRIADQPNFLYFTPGVNLEESADAVGQQWRLPRDAVVRDGNDLVIVGRGVCQASDPSAAATRYREAGWEAWLERQQPASLPAKQLQQNGTSDPQKEVVSS